MRNCHRCPCLFRGGGLFLRAQKIASVFLLSSWINEITESPSCHEINQQIAWKKRWKKVFRNFIFSRARNFQSKTYLALYCRICTQFLFSNPISSFTWLTACSMGYEKALEFGTGLCFIRGQNRIRIQSHIWFRSVLPFVLLASQTRTVELIFHCSGPSPSYLRSSVSTEVW